MKRAIIIVIDALGIGAMPDAPEYGDVMECNTLVNVAKANKGLNLPNFQKLGLGNIDNILGVQLSNAPMASFGKMMEKSKGKDTTTGHWEMTGLILENPFKTYPNGFPKKLLDEFIDKTASKTILGNCAASGTEIISQLGDRHVKSGCPIIYTSADSVFQIACHVDVVPLERLYRYCEIARDILDRGEYGVSRVIARPFEGKSGQYTRISAGRKDYSVPPPSKTVLDAIVENNGRVVGIGKIEDIFVKAGITHSMHTGNNLEGLRLTTMAAKKMLMYNKMEIAPCSPNVDKELVFVNLVDTDMLYGHRNDPFGYRKALVEIDENLAEIIKSIGADDLLIITADHGCDPTVAGTDHTREMVPILIYNPKISGKNLGTRETFADVAATVAKWIDVPYSGPGVSMV